ncbi:MAG: N-6 DNA methylase, partial [Microscillaceae bacterium]|nr:N-6 DNA methylase [Microscillaceae bacterium]MDW8459763.1 N-6 DNA methylase [Cytophagales bacterium]
MQEFVKYYDTLKSQDLSEITEHTLRPVLNELLTSIAKELNPNIKIIHEPKREGKFGAPDFKVFEADNIIGYVENKKIDESLDKVLKSEQIKKYKELSNNLLLTNYLEWFWIHNGEVQRRESLCSIADIENQHFQLNSDKAKVVKELITHYLSTPPQGIAEAKKLAESLAIRARLLKDFIFEELERQKLLEDQPKLKGLYHTFKDFIFSDLTTSEFSDAFAQTLIYGLFLAKLNADLQQVNLYNVSQFIPTSFQLIKELVDFLKELENPNYKEIRWIVEEVLTIMNTLDLRAIQANLSFSKSEDPSESLELFESSHKDPYIYFYEDFLAAYDKDLRKAKGVYYTPSAVVSFIVKSINEILRNDFNIKTGLADEKQVTVLDFATGTGTFLVEIFQVIFETISNSGKKNLLIKEHLLKNIYGFEYLIAPYTIAHLKLSQFLREQGYELTDGERIQVFLTNTLEPIDKQIKIPLLPALTKESRNAQEIKDKPILVITGNPPYSVSSSNKSSFIDNLMRKYKEGLQEKNIQSLSDDYIKFICFAHDKIEKAGRGVIAIITNNSYLSGSIHRKMRETLYKDFDKIYVLNLHGNSLRKEQGENVFDIRIGVSILFLVKLEKYQKEKQVFYFSTQAREILTRKDKFSFLSNNDLSTVRWLELKPQSPDFWFIEKDLSNQAEYNQFWSVTEIFKNYTSGVKTHRDK